MAPHELFAAMSPALSTEIFEYTHTNDKQLYHGALDVVAQMRKVRPVFLERQPRAERYATMRAVLSRPNAALAADNLIRNWLLKKHNAVLIDFLDSLKIKHDKGVVETIPQSVDDAALKQGIDALLAKYPAETVALYLHAFNDMDEARWKNLNEILASDPRLKLGDA
ncbi:MAG TPA: hypothetical protein VK615_16975 [Candidatus Binatia bacterium]|nr:hypothetical protein [Candidatus Binatia bacterium]